MEAGNENKNENQDGNLEAINTEEQVQEEVKTWKIASEDQPYHDTVHKLYDNVEEEKQVKETVIDNVETEIEEEVIQVEEEVVNIIDEQAVISFLKEKGFNAESLEDLKPKEAKKLTPELEKFLEYQEQTGNTNYDDFKATQKDWLKEPQENVLRHILKNKYPDLDEEEIDFKFRKQYSFDPDYDDEDVVMEKKINLKTDYREGLELLEKQKEQYMVRKGFDESVPEEYRNAKEIVDNWTKQQEEGKNAFEQERADFMEKTNNLFTQDFEGFKINVGGQEFKVKPEDVQATKNHLSDLDNFSKKFYDESGKLKSPTEYYKALYFAMNADKMADHFINVGKAMQEEANERESKNITVQNNKSVQNPISNSVTKWTVVKE